MYIDPNYITSIAKNMPLVEAILKEVEFPSSPLPGHEDRKGYYMHTYTGRRYFPCDPRPEEVDIRDIAHHLAQQCRFAGANLRKVSVAEHSVLASYVGRRGDKAVFESYPLKAMHKLMHDSAETYLQDMIRPLKYLPMVHPIYARLEKLNEAAIGARFTIETFMDADIKFADETVCSLEMRDNIRNLDKGHLHQEVEIPEGLELHYWNEDNAEYMFLERFRELGGHVPLDP